ncbi:MAG: hypothetical protein KGH72_00215 [Candidatus Micrarchaeota archaeon]|nr:hypothetical protein [Candidatus Micrarchaeota archaeon]
MYILGIWDGHDSGAALVKDNKILFAANEERYTKRKLEVSFPSNSIKAALDFEGIKPDQIGVVAFPTLEFTKTLSRIFPMQKETYYKFRRRKMLRPRTTHLMHYAKYSMTSIGVLPLCKAISNASVSHELRRLGFGRVRLYNVEHHAAHAATAAFTSGFGKSLVVTMDGVGDGLCGTISTFENGELTRRQEIGAANSIGIFFEQVTNIVGMRELEDEGKVMAMADYSFPFEFEKNRLKEFYTVKGLEIKAKYGPIKQYNMLDRIAWTMPREQFAYMAQQLLEKTLVEFFGNAIGEFGLSDVAMAGGIMSNVKANMKIRNLDSLKRWFIFPHMGDGGIALGAALYANYELNGVTKYDFNDSYLGTGYDDRYMEDVLREEKDIEYEHDRNKASHAADIIADDNYLFWFQGRMEYGPRALGNRSILANAGSDNVKEKLNLYVKQREWYQPFAPSMLDSEADNLLKNIKGHDRFMTMAYDVRKDRASVMKSVMHIDMTARPQMVGGENKEYERLLRNLKKKTGYGLVLNTSFNLHGMPIVLDPKDALLTMKKTKTRHMFMGNFYIENKQA